MDRFKNLASVEEEEDDDEEDDEDYVPSKEDLENDDDADKDGDSSDSGGDSGGDNDDDDDDDGSKKKKRRGRKRKASASKDDAENVSGDGGKELSSDEKKRKADDLWAELNSSSSAKPEAKPVIVAKDSGAKVEKVYEFAGEKVVVEESAKPITSSSSSSIGQSSTPSPLPSLSTVRRSGLKDLVSNLGKKNKIGTLQKSKIDWDSFKRDQGIEDELKQATLSKDGYVERQAFLSRADVRQFEIEKSIRSHIRKPQ